MTFLLMIGGKNVQERWVIFNIAELKTTNRQLYCIVNCSEDSNLQTTA